MDEFLDFVRPNKDSKILDVAAGTGLIGKIVSLWIYINKQKVNDIYQGRLLKEGSRPKKRGGGSPKGIAAPSL